jgi:hypothetical protein
VAPWLERAVLSASTGPREAERAGGAGLGGEHGRGIGFIFSFYFSPFSLFEYCFKF